MIVQVRYGTLHVPSLLQDGMLTAAVGISWGELKICLTSAMENIQDIRPKA